MEDENKNIQLTLVQPTRQTPEETTIDLFVVWTYIKRFFLLWLALAVAVAAIASSVSIWHQSTSFDPSVNALIGFSYEGVENGLDPNGDPLDVTKLSSPTVVAQALSAMNVELDKLDDVRANLSITGVISGASYDRQKLYYSILARSGNSDTVNTILSAGYGMSQYIVTFNYRKAGFAPEEGTAVLNEVLNAYRDYFNETYNDNSALGSAVNVVSYRDYDCAEAVNLFTETLDSVESYLREIVGVSRYTALEDVLELTGNEILDYRSSRTGFTFRDLLRTNRLLQEIDLDQVSAYVSANSVTRSDTATATAYYEWLVENLEQDKAVLDTTIATLTASIEAYEKDPVVITENGDTANEKTDYYDDMVRQKLSTQREVAALEHRISYYENVIKGFRGKRGSSEEEIEQAYAYLDQLSEKVSAFVTNVNETANEYYEKAAFAENCQVLVPASVPSGTTTQSNTLQVVGIAEAVLLVLYLGAAVIYAIKPQGEPQEKKAGETAEA